MEKVRFDYAKAGNVIAPHEMENMEKIAEAAREVLVSKSGAGNDFLGWIPLIQYYKNYVLKIQWLHVLPNKNRQFRSPIIHLNEGSFEKSGDRRRL